MSIGSVTIVGASLAGHASAKALRAQGFDGLITMIGGEEHRPYDRPPLSKEFLAGKATVADLALEVEDEDLAAEWMLGARAVRLDPAAGTATHTVTLADGRAVTSDAVVIATGSFAKNLNLTTLGGLSIGAHTLRTVDDAEALRDALRPGAKLVVVGSGFVGLEVASTAVDLGVDTLVLGSSEWPLSRIFGDTVANSVQRLHEAHGVRVRNNVRVDTLLGTERVTGVRLSTGEEIPAEIVVLSIGSIPAVGWLASSGLDLANGVVCDETGATGVPGIVAVGDCSAWFDPVRGRPHRIEHWTDSRDRPAIAMAALLGREAPARALRPSYLWSDQCGARIQFAGRLLGDEVVEVESGSVDAADLFVVYRRAGEPVAVVGINQPKLVAQWRKRLASPAPYPQPVTALTSQGV
jgi:NADPH-dependent 2,4-dienoyl-CoA reductase/sulfur reductase-like enzyme